MNADFRHLAHLIRSGAYYDELTDAEKDEYCLYCDVSRNVFETVTFTVLETLHTPLEFKKPPPTAAELEKTIQEVQEYIEELKRERTENY